MTKQEAIDLLDNLIGMIEDNHGSDYDSAIRMAINALKNQPEIIRCKDCKFSYMTYNGECKYCDIWFPDEKMYLDGDYFCASAELKGDSDEN